jgi:ribosomal protein L11 methyltransferase
LVLDAGMAFGSGEHGSTRSCLRALELVARRKPARILDLGTGTGVLALAAARLLHRRVVAADIDPWSVRNTRDNAARNALAPFVRVGRADGWRSAWVRRAGPYDLVLANILARPLCKMARRLARNLAPGGQAILSGLLVRQVAWVAGVHRAQGLVLVDVIKDGNWAALVVRRPFS